jgi:hypothetical protein
MLSIKQHTDDLSVYGFMTYLCIILYANFEVLQTTHLMCTVHALEDLMNTFPLTN